MKTRILVFLVLVVMLVSSGCQVIETFLTEPTEAPTSPTIPATGAPTFAPAVVPGQTLSIFMIDWTKPFADKVDAGDDIMLGSWSPAPYMGQDLLLPLSIDQVANIDVLGSHC